jgi:hypothetical protein
MPALDAQNAAEQILSEILGSVFEKSAETDESGTGTC